jgi:hypothetical protein
MIFKRNTYWIPAIILLAMVSCKKDRVCHCEAYGTKVQIEYSESSGPTKYWYTPYSRISEGVIDARTTKAQAKATCLSTKEAITREIEWNEFYDAGIFEGHIEGLEVNCTLK